MTSAGILCHYMVESTRTLKINLSVHIQKLPCHIINSQQMAIVACMMVTVVLYAFTLNILKLKNKNKKGPRKKGARAIQ